MSLTVKINIKDDKGKEAELEIQETDNLSKLVIIQNVFSLFGIEKDILDQVNEFEKIDKAYSNFFEKMNQEEKNKEMEDIVADESDDIKEQMINGLQQTEELKQVYEAVNDQPEWVRTGIKVDPDGRKRYKSRYHCVICNNKGTHYIFEEASEIKCHSCKMKMPVSPAHPKGFRNEMDNSTNSDSFGNYFRAGDYLDWKLT
ncbi:hypothetical protein [Brevibacillus sp. NRS-1366]|uniref:hypothetical protein n=1 Tax=Brevibacillus sp. NRS-1366 TaxID=3233899 RepID=UPI003D21A23A